MRFIIHTCIVKYWFVADKNMYMELAILCSLFSLTELLICKGIIQNVRIIAILYEKTGKSFLGNPFKLFYSYGIINKIDFSI